MRIAVYHHLLSGGAVRSLECMLAARRSRHRYELFIPDSADRDFTSLKRLVDAVHVLPGAKATSLATRYTQLLKVPAIGKEAARRIEAGGFDALLAHPSHITQAPEPLPYLRNVPSVYYCHESLREYYEPRTVQPRGVKPRTKALLSIPLDRYRIRFDRRAMAAADIVLTNSRFTARNIRKNYGRSAHVAYNGVDSRQFRPGRKRRQPVVVSVGALDPVKGHQFVIESVGLIPPDHRPRVVVVGDRGDSAEAFRQAAGRLGVDFEIRRRATQGQLIKLYQEAAVFAAGQYREPFGLVVLEAMACETPVVAVKEGGLREIVSDRKTGLLVPRSRQAFAAAVSQVLADPKRAARFGKAARADCVNKWRWERQADTIEFYLERAAGQR